MNRCGGNSHITTGGGKPSEKWQDDMEKSKLSLRSGVQNMLPVIAVLLGAALAFLRAGELGGSFETDDMLAKHGDVMIVATRALTVAAAVLIAVLSRIARPRTGKFAEVYGGSKFSKSMYTIGAMALIVAAVFDFAKSGSDSIARLILMALAVLAGATLLLALVSKEKNQTAFYSLVSTFFACFWLIIIYRDRTTSPSVELYIYDMLAVVAAVLVFYQAAAVAYETARPRTALFVSLAALMLSIMVVLGTVIAALRGTVIADTGMVGYHVAVAVWALGASKSLSAYTPVRAE